MGGPPRSRLTAGAAVIGALATVTFVYAGNFRDRPPFAEAAVRGSQEAIAARQRGGGP